MKQKRSSPKNVRNGLNPKTMSVSESESMAINRSTVNGIKGNQTKATNGANGTTSPGGYCQRPNHPNQSRTQSLSTPKSASNAIRSPVAVLAKQWTQSPSGDSLPNYRTDSSVSNGLVTNSRHTSQSSQSHSYPKTSQMSSLLSSAAQQWSQSSVDPLLQTRYAGSRFTEAPNPSLLPKPPKHWMSANAINTAAIDSTNYFGHQIPNGHPLDRSDDNVIALKLMQFFDFKAAETNTSIANNGVKQDMNRMLIKN